MGQLVSEHVKDNWARQTEESDQPENCAQREEPELFARPKPLRHGRARKDSEKCLTKNCTDRQQKNRKNKLYPACGDHERIGRGNESCSPRDASDDLSATVRSTLFVCRSSIRR